MQYKNSPSGTYANGQLEVLAGVEVTYELENPCGTCGSHPLILSPSSSGGFGATEWAGPISIAGANFRYTASAGNLTSGLYYQCNIHSGMGARVVNVTTPRYGFPFV